MMRKNHIIYSVLVIILLLFLEGTLNLMYVPKQVLRLILFLLVPLVYIYFIDRSNIVEEFNFGKPSKRELTIAIISAVVILVGTFGGYYVLQFMFDPTTTIEGLEEIGVSVHNVLFWGLYLSLVNSLVEEFFFRGFIYNAIEMRSRRLAVIISGLLFSLYHGLLFYSIFAWYTVIFTLAGLFIIGAFLAYINRYGKGFINSYIIHIFANIGCVLVLLHMVYLVG